MRGCAGRFLTLRVEVVVHEIYCSSLVYLHGKLIQKGKEAILAEIIFNEFYNNYKTLFLVFLKLILNQYFIIENAHDRIFLLFKTLYCMGKNNNNPNKQPSAVTLLINLRAGTLKTGNREHWLNLSPQTV